jgi:hypothetical protein
MNFVEIANRMPKRLPTFHELKGGTLFTSADHGHEIIWLKLCDHFYERAASLRTGVVMTFTPTDVVQPVVKGESVVIKVND